MKNRVSDMWKTFQLFSIITLTKSKAFMINCIINLLTMSFIGIKYFTLNTVYFKLFPKILIR